MSAELVKFDKIKYEHLKNKTSHFLTTNDLMDVRARLKTQTLSTVSALNTSFSKWERCFLTANDLNAPTMEDITKDPTAFDMYSRIRVGEKLLSMWGISFTSA